jgi:DNA polymerase-3 subunit epsilon
MGVFTAIDFETANRYRDSACAIGAVRVEQGVVVERYHRLVRPGTRRFDFTWLHGITWSDVARAPPFERVWPELRALLRGVDFVVAHDARFDLGVLHACCQRAGITPPKLRVECTLARARARGFRPATLPAIAQHLRIPLRRLHVAVEDAEACARIALATGLG